MIRNAINVAKSQLESSLPDVFVEGLPRPGDQQGSLPDKV